jgi:hypothetical protein
MTAVRRLDAIVAVDFLATRAFMGEDGAGSHAVRQHCETQNGSDTLVLRCLAETHS